MPTDPASMPAGILQTRIETGGKSVTIDYDPRALSDESVRQVAVKLAPEAQRRFGKCVMRLGGRACEACALKLERKAERIEGVRRARATFIGGVMSVTFDNAQLSPQRVIEQVRDTGAPVTPLAIPPKAPLNVGEWLQYHVAGIEVACTAATFVFMIVGWLAPPVGFGLAWANTFFAAAHIAGGIFGVQSRPSIAASMDHRCRFADDIGGARCRSGRSAV